MSIDAEIEVTAGNNAVSGDIAVSEYGAAVAREYADQAKEYAEQAVSARNIAEAWAESGNPPTGEGTRSAKSWTKVSQAWAESDAEPDGVSGARSSKSWNTAARQWAEGDGEPDGVDGAKSAKTWAETASSQAAVAAARANEALVSQQAAAASAKAALASQTAAASSETSARQNAESAAAKLAQMMADLKLKADVASPALTGTPTAPKADGSNTAQIANVSYVGDVVNAAMEKLVNGSSAALDTLQELGKALGNDPNFATTMTNALAQKLDKTDNAMSATKAVQDGDGNIITSTYATKAEVTGTAASLAKVAASGSYNDLLDRPVIPSKTSQLTNDSRFVQTDTSGNVTLTGTLTATKVFNAYYNDYAEFFPRGGGTLKGDIIAVDESSAREQYVQATDKSKCVVGVQSEDFAFVIGGRSVEAGESILEKNMDSFIPVALAGRVYVRFMGRAETGGVVVPSEIPGVGRMAAEGDDTGQCVGRIVRADNGQNVRLVKILVGR